MHYWHHTLQDEAWQVLLLLSFICCLLGRPWPTKKSVTWRSFAGTEVSTASLTREYFDLTHYIIPESKPKLADFYDGDKRWSPFYFNITQKSVKVDKFKLLLFCYSVLGSLKISIWTSRLLWQCRLPDTERRAWLFLTPNGLTPFYLRLWGSFGILPGLTFSSIGLAWICK